MARDKAVHVDRSFCLISVPFYASFLAIVVMS